MCEREIERGWGREYVCQEWNKMEKNLFLFIQKFVAAYKSLKNVSKSVMLRKRRTTFTVYPFEYTSTSIHSRMWIRLNTRDVKINLREVILQKCVSFLTVLNIFFTPTIWGWNPKFWIHISRLFIIKIQLRKVRLESSINDVTF